MAPNQGLPHVLPLWPLALAAGMLPAVAALLAVALFSEARGSLCNPFVDDCVSISRMARHGLANHLFRALVLPGAVLQLLTWLAAAQALVGVGLARREGLVLGVTGVCAGLALVVYASFLGSDGEAYRWLRRWGTLVYFGGTYLAMLLFVRAAQRLHMAGRLALPRGHERAMVALLAFIAAISLGHVFTSLVAPAVLVDRIENLTEWWAALALTLCLATVASLWRRWALTATIGLQRPGR